MGALLARQPHPYKGPRGLGLAVALLCLTRRAELAAALLRFDLDWRLHFDLRPSNHAATKRQSKYRCEEHRCNRHDSPPGV